MKQLKEIFLLLWELSYLVITFVALTLGLWNGMVEGDFILGTFCLVLALVSDAASKDCRKNREERKRERSLQRFLDEQGVDVKAKDYRGKGSRP